MFKSLKLCVVSRASTLQFLVFSVSSAMDVFWDVFWTASARLRTFMLNDFNANLTTLVATNGTVRFLFLHALPIPPEDMANLENKIMQPDLEFEFCFIDGSKIVKASDPICTFDTLWTAMVAAGLPKDSDIVCVNDMPIYSHSLLDTRLYHWIVHDDKPRVRVTILKINEEVEAKRRRLEEIDSQDFKRRAWDCVEREYRKVLMTSLRLESVTYGETFYEPSEPFYMSDVLSDASDVFNVYRHIRCPEPFCILPREDVFFCRLPYVLKGLSGFGRPHLFATRETRDGHHEIYLVAGGHESSTRSFYLMPLVVPRRGNVTVL